MPTPKFNAIALQFMEIINDHTTVAGSPEVVVAGKILNTVAKIETFVNRGLLQLFTEVLLQSNGDPETIGRILPELIKPMTPTTTAGGIYTLATPYLNYFNPAGSPLRTVDSKVIRQIDNSLVNEVLSGMIEEYTPSADSLFFYENGGIFTFLPLTEFNAKALSLYYVAKPVNQTTGLAFTSGGTYDSPFQEHWTMKIAELAADIYLITVGEK